MLIRRLGTLALAAVVSAAPAAVAGSAVVMSGLDNPRGMAFAPNGALYVVEAGRGGEVGDGSRCSAHIPGEYRCYGATGAITRLWRGVQQRVLEGLPSQAIAQPAALAGTLAGGGPQGIGFLGTGAMFVILGLGGTPEVLERFGDPLMGTLVQPVGNDRVRVAGDVALHEFDQNPAGGRPDSNPFGLLVEPHGKFVADAGGNTLLRVRNSGEVDTIAVFPTKPNPTPVGPPNIESVPTSVARGPDGELYVGELTGVPFVAGLANVYRVIPGLPPEVHCSGFKTIMGIAFARDGTLYVVEHASGGPLFFPPNSGRLLRVASDCSRTVVLDGLDRPASVVVGRDGAIYVTNKGGTPGQGEVLRVDP